MQILHPGFLSKLVFQIKLDECIKYFGNCSSTPNIAQGIVNPMGGSQRPRFDSAAELSARKAVCRLTTRGLVPVILSASRAIL